MEKTYQQCKLQQGTRHDTVWLESRGAKVGNRVKLIGEGGLWDVISVGSYKITEEQKNDQERFFKSHRKGSDI